MRNSKLSRDGTTKRLSGSLGSASAIRDAPIWVIAFLMCSLCAISIFVYWVIEWLVELGVERAAVMVIAGSRFACAVYSPENGGDVFCEHVGDESHHNDCS